MRACEEFGLGTSMLSLTPFCVDRLNVCEKRTLNQIFLTNAIDSDSAGGMARRYS